MHKTTLKNILLESGEAVENDRTGGHGREHGSHAGGDAQALGRHASLRVHSDADAGLRQRFQRHSPHRAL